MNALTKELTSGALGGLTFLAFLMGVKLTPLLAGFLSVASYVGLRFLLPVNTVDEVAPGVAREDWLTTLAQGQQVAGDVRKMAKKKNTAMAKTIGEIAEIVDRITARLKEDPACHTLVGLFLQHEVKEVIPVLTKYMELAGRARKSAKLRNELARSERIIPLIRNKMDEHYQKLLRNDLMEFEVASETLAAFLGVDEFELQQMENKK